MDCSDLSALFQRAGVPTDKPGFCDHPAFLRAETQIQGLLDRYAQFVQCQAPADAERVRGIAEAVAHEVADSINKSGQPGACIDAALATSWMLSQEGVWNFVVKGGLVIEARVNGRSVIQYFSQHDVNGADAGHAWVVAPPFRGVDGALRHQPYSAAGLASVLPLAVVADGEQVSNLSPADHCSADLMARTDVRGAHQAVLRFGSITPPVYVNFEGGKLKYVPCGVTAQYPEWTPDAPAKVGRSARQMLREVAS